MISKEKLTKGLKVFVSEYLDKIAETNPLISVLKPLATRAASNKINSIKPYLDLISEEDGSIDIAGILTETVESLIKTAPFNFNFPVVGDVLMGGGRIELGIPFINKNIVFTDKDINYLKELLISDNYGRNNVERVPRQ